jgi:asparagine synthase (glutamine-hydrolysing)
MSMAHSIETRVPFLDHWLVEYVMGLPQAWKIDSQVNKPLLVQALNGSLPQSVWQRPKMGFTFPFAEWMKQQADTFAEDGSGHSLLNRSATKDVWEKFKAGRLHWSRPWALAVLGAMSTEQGARSRGRRATGKEHGAGCTEQGARGNKPRTGMEASRTSIDVGVFRR